MANEETTFYETPNHDPRDRIEVEIGDSKQPDFQPQMKVMRWDNEENFSVRLVHDEIDPVVTDTGVAVEWLGERQKAEFYEIPPNEIYPEGASEVEITLLERPDTNKVQFSINTKGLEFLYQGELTPAEIKLGAERPENVIGSYAVYATQEKRNVEGGKEYRSGKFGHIYRPRMIDAKGAEVWAERLEVDIEKNLLTVTIPQEFIENATYPIRHAAGLTFGYTTAGGSGITVGAGSSFAMVSKGTVSSDGDVDSISVYGGSSSGCPVKGGVWKFSDLTLLTNGATGVGAFATGGAQWSTVNYSVKPAVSLSVADYYAGVILASSPNDATIYYDTSTGNGGFDYGHNYTTPTNLATLTNTSNRWSIYATYTASAPVGHPTMRRWGGVKGMLGAGRIGRSW